MRVAWSRSSITGEKRPSSSKPSAVVVVALAPQACAVECHRAHGVERACVEVPPVGREEPRPADDVTLVDGLDGDSAAARGEDLELHAPVSQEIEGVRLAALAEEVVARLEPGVLAAARDQLQLRRGQASKDRALRELGVERLHACSSPAVARIAATSSVMSMATGHQVMQRPQPTQPELPNWSCQVPSLCVSHWR